MHHAWCSSVAWRVHLGAWSLDEARGGWPCVSDSNQHAACWGGKKRNIFVIRQKIMKLAHNKRDGNSLSQYWTVTCRFYDPGVQLRLNEGQIVGAECARWHGGLRARCVEPLLAKLVLEWRVYLLATN